MLYLISDTEFVLLGNYIMLLRTRRLFSYIFWFPLSSCQLFSPCLLPVLLQPATCGLFVSFFFLLQISVLIPLWIKCAFWKALICETWSSVLLASTVSWAGGIDFFSTWIRMKYQLLSKLGFSQSKHGQLRLNLSSTELLGGIHLYFTRFYFCLMWWNLNI